MKECTRQRREDRLPAQQAEQAAEQGVLDVVHGRGSIVQMVAYGELHAALWRARQAQLKTAFSRRLASACLRNAKLALQPL